MIPTNDNKQCQRLGKLSYLTMQLIQRDQIKEH